MAAPSLLFPSADPVSPSDFAAHARVAKLRSAAVTARDRVAEIAGVRVIGPEIPSERNASGVRLAIDLRDTGKDAWDVACVMASRGFPLDAASHRVIVVRLSDADLADGIHMRLAPALQIALWSTPGATG